MSASVVGTVIVVAIGFSFYFAELGRRGSSSAPQQGVPPFDGGDRRLPGPARFFTLLMDALFAPFFSASKSPRTPRRKISAMVSAQVTASGSILGLYQV